MNPQELLWHIVTEKLPPEFCQLIRLERLNQGDQLPLVLVAINTVEQGELLGQATKIVGEISIISFDNKEPWRLAEALESLNYATGQYNGLDWLFYLSPAETEAELIGAEGDQYQYAVKWRFSLWIV